MCSIKGGPKFQIMRLWYFFLAIDIHNHTVFSRAVFAIHAEKAWELLWYWLRKYSKSIQKMLLPCCVDKMGCLIFVLLSSLLFFLHFGKEQLYNTEGNAIKRNRLDKVPWCMSITSGFTRLRPEDEEFKANLKVAQWDPVAGKEYGVIKYPILLPQHHFCTQSEVINRVQL